MQLPRYKKRLRLKHKVCREPGCGREYWGHTTSKYCEHHSDQKNRVRRRRPKTDPGVVNYIHNPIIREPIDMVRTCSLEGCYNTYQFRVIPHVTVYPRFCDAHRSEFRRINFLRLREKNLIAA